MLEDAATRRIPKDECERWTIFIEGLILRLVLCASFFQELNELLIHGGFLAETFSYCFPWFKSCLESRGVWYTSIYICAISYQDLTYFGSTKERSLVEAGVQPTALVENVNVGAMGD